MGGRKCIHSKNLCCLIFPILAAIFSLEESLYLFLPYIFLQVMTSRCRHCAKLQVFHQNLNRCFTFFTFSSGVSSFPRPSTLLLNVCQLSVVMQLTSSLNRRLPFFQSFVYFVPMSLLHILCQHENTSCRSVGILPPPTKWSRLRTNISVAIHVL